MNKHRSANDHTTRESWLRAATNELRPIFAKVGLQVPEAMRFSIAFTSLGKPARTPTRESASGRWPAECWPAAASADRHCEIILRADLSEPSEVLAVLVHELIHACLPEAKHGKDFRDAALRLGLEGPMRYAVPGAALRERLNELGTSLGPLPHARLNFDQVTLAGLAISDRPKKQSTRMLKAECLASGCGYVVRVAARWINDCGPPHCPRHGAMTTPPLPVASEDAEDISPADAESARALQERAALQVPPPAREE